MALAVWQVVWASLIPPTKIQVLTPPWIIRFEVWGIKGLSLVVKSISLLYLNYSIDLRKVRAVNSLVGGASQMMHGFSTLDPIGTEGT